MSDYEIDEIRRIRHKISAEHGHDLRKLAAHYRKLEEELRKSGQFKFADEHRKPATTARTEDAI
jgi:hypothetical protein